MLQMSIPCIITPDRKSKTMRSHSHAKPTGKFRFERDFYPIIIQGLQNLEDGQHLGHQRPHRGIGKVSPDTDAPTEAIHDVFDIIRFEGTIVVEESLGYERMWVRIPGFFMSCQNGSSAPLWKNVKHTDQRCGMRIAPEKQVSMDARWLQKTVADLPFGMWNPSYMSSSIAT